MGKNYAYVRVSTREQKEDRQLAAMTRQGVPWKNVFSDKRSGKDFERPGYKKLMKKIGKGDVLFIKSIDRLGRNYFEILERWAFITKEKGADIVVLDMPLLDTRVKDGDLTGTFIADLVLQILSYVAQTERDFIRKRQAEGIAMARRKGLPLGRRKSSLSPEFRRVAGMYTKGDISSRQARESLGMSHTTFWRRCKELDLLPPEAAL